jgi:hypothetical protein
MLSKIRPSPALVVASIALFVALGGTAVAVGIVPRARLADNALKLQGKTPVQVAALAPKPPVAPTSVAGLISVKTAPWSLNPRAESNFTVSCDAGQRAVAGGWSDPGNWSSGYQSLPTPDDSGWTTNIYTSSGAPSAQSGTVYAICVK